MESLVVAVVRQPATALFFVAQAAGCFEREALRVEERTFELGRDALSSMLERQADLAVAYETPVLRAAFGDPQLRVLTTLHTSTRNTRLVARRTSGIDGFGDLAGKRVGVASGTNADFFADLILTFGGVPRSRVHLVNASPEASVSALTAGELDAAVLSDPPAGDAERALGAEAVVLRTDLYSEASLLVARRDLVLARAAAIRALLRGLRCGELLATGQPDRALALLRSRFPETTEDSLRAQVARVTWGLGLDHTVLDLLQRERHWLETSGLVEGSPPDVDELLAPTPLEQVSPESVMLLPRPGGRR